MTQEVDVVVNVYNEADNLVAFLDSLVAQTTQNFRLIFVDDGSTDDSVAIAHGFSTRLDLTIVELAHIGLRGARAEAVKLVTAPIFIIFDADQVIDKYAVARLAESFAEPKIGGATGLKISAQQAWSDRGHRVVARTAFNAMRRADGTTQQLSGGCFACRTSAIRELGGFASHDLYAEDAEISYRLHEAGWKLIARDDVIVYHKDPQGVIEMIKWGWRMGRLGLYTRLAHKQQFFSWHVLVRFGTLGILLCFFAVPWLAAIGLLGSLGLFLLQIRQIEASWRDKVLAWIVFLLKSFGWSIAFVYVAITQLLLPRLRGEGVNEALS